MKLLRVTAQGLPLFKEKLDLPFYAQQRVAEEDKINLYSLFSNIYLNPANAFIGINASGKTSVLKVLLLALGIINNEPINHINTSAVKKELQQLSTFSQIKEIRDKELNSVILSHLEMSEDLVEGIKSEWEQKKIFKKQIKGDDGTTLIEDSYCTRSYVREIILRYCQNRTFFRTKFNIKDGNLF